MANAVGFVPSSSGEAEARRSLAACYRLFARERMDLLIYNHISLRVPSEPDHFLVNAFGEHYSEITASSLAKVGPDGVSFDSSKAINQAGFVIHSAIHEARPDVNCVIHWHGRASTAVACQAEGLLPISQDALVLMAQTGYQSFEGIAVDLAERRRIAENLDGNHLLLLRNHGAIATGATVGSAFVRAIFLERACEIQLGAQLGQVSLLSQDVQQRVAEQVEMLSFGSNADREWAAMLRLLDREQPNYSD